MSAVVAPTRDPPHAAPASAEPLPTLATPSPERCGLIGEHATMREVYRLMARAAPTLAPVLLLGESGTGRESIARCIHERSPVVEGPWITVRCASGRPEALERTLFGSERETEAGRMSRETGSFELAAGGTILLDDVAELTPALQARLLRVVQHGEIERVGTGGVIPVRARIIATSTRDLRKAAGDGRFRNDLYFRLAIVTIHVPRLADRGDDLMLLVAMFAQQFLRRAGATRAVTHIAARAKQALLAHPWPENVRELRDVIEHAVLVTPGDTIELADLPDAFQDDAPRSTRALARGKDEPTSGASHTNRRGPETHDAQEREGTPRTGRFPTLAEVEARHIALALAESQGVIHVAAELLGIHRNTLTRKIRDYRL